MLRPTHARSRRKIASLALTLTTAVTSVAACVLTASPAAASTTSCVQVADTTPIDFLSVSARSSATGLEKITCTFSTSANGLQSTVIAYVDRGVRGNRTAVNNSSQTMPYEAYNDAAFTIVDGPTNTVTVLCKTTSVTNTCTVSFPIYFVFPPNAGYPSGNGNYTDTVNTIVVSFT